MHKMHQHRPKMQLHIYPQTPTPTINATRLSGVASSSNSTSLERRCFEYYFHHAAPLLSGTLHHPFWSVSVLQLCRTEPAIWDGIISLSALFERPPITDESCPTTLIDTPVVVRYEYHQDALTWYSRFLAGLRQRINRGRLCGYHLRQLLFRSTFFTFASLPEHYQHHPPRGRLTRPIDDPSQ